MLMLVFTAAAGAHSPGCNSTACDAREGQHYAAHHERLGPVEEHRATVYSGECNHQSNHMADGTKIMEPGGALFHDGKPVDIHALASSYIPVGTRIKFDLKVFGSRYWTVRDSGGEFDLYRPDCNYSGSPGLTNPRLRFRRVLS